MEYANDEEFLETFMKYPKENVLEKVLYNQYLSIEEKERRVLMGLSKVEPTYPLFASSFYTAPRVFWKLYILDRKTGDKIMRLPFYSTDKDVLMCVEISVHLCLLHKEAVALCREISNMLLTKACEVGRSREEREGVWFFAKRYYDRGLLESLRNEDNSRWIVGKLV